MSAQYTHAPNGAARKRTLKQLAHQRDVPCVMCERPISAARAACPISRGLCVDCNAPNLKLSPEARERTPVYETQAWERGERLD